MSAPTPIVTPYVSDQHTSSITAWCKANIGKVGREWDYDVRLVGEMFVCKIHIVSASHQLLFDIAWSDLDIYHSTRECYLEYLQRRKLRRAAERWEC